MNMRRTLGIISSTVVLIATITMSRPIASPSFLDAVRNTTCDPHHFNKSMFPKDFIFGAGSSSYQFEGAYNIDGKGQSVWDTFTHEHPEKVLDHSTGDVAADQYHLYKEDIALMKELGMEAYRFSISWSRILPNGKMSGGVNEKGLEYYNNLINEIIAHGMKPFVTILHYDLPQHLQFEYGGFLSRCIVPDFQEYAELLFEKLGDRVKHWITLNEPYALSYYAYNLGVAAPGRCSNYMGNCSYGNSETEPYIVAHNQLLAHAAAVDVYRKKYKAKQHGTIGITLVCSWMEPHSCSDNDKKAHLRALDFMFGWFMNPITTGDYPASMIKKVGKRLPIFSDKEKKMIKGSIDFLGLNYYTGMYVSDAKTVDPPSYSTYIGIQISTERDGIPIGERTDIADFFIYPQGFKKVLLYLKEYYHNPIIYITENDNKSLSHKEALRDPQRIKYFCSHLQSLRDSIKKGVNVRGYFAWALLDNFEWPSGYTDRFGILYVDFADNLQRYKKRSAVWFQNFLRPNN